MRRRPRKERSQRPQRRPQRKKGKGTRVGGRFGSLENMDVLSSDYTANGVRRCSLSRATYFQISRVRSHRVNVTFVTQRVYLSSQVDFHESSNRTFTIF